MTETHMRHPQSVVALAIVRDRLAISHRSSIRSVAMFGVSKCPECGAPFAIDHRLFDRRASRVDIIDGIAARIPQGGTVIAQGHDCRSIPCGTVWLWGSLCRPMISICSRGGTQTSKW